MQIHQISRIHKNKKTMIVGRGGKRGKTAGRGTKGQKARAGHKIRPEYRDLIKKLPKLRGRGKNSNVSIQTKPVVVNVSVLEEHFENGASVSREALLAKGLIELRGGVMPQVKILGGGELKKKLVFVGINSSKSARQKAGIQEKAPAEVKSAAPAPAKTEAKPKKK